MSFREIPDFSAEAIGNGCFFLNDGGRKKIRDEITGHRRFERTFTSDRMIEFGDYGIVEISERAARHMAHELGWISLKESHRMTEELADLTEKNFALKEQNKEAVAWNNGLLAQLAKHIPAEKKKK